MGREPVSGEGAIKIKHQEESLRGADVSVDLLKKMRTLEGPLGVEGAQKMLQLAFAHSNNGQRYVGGTPIGMPSKKMSGRAGMNWPKAIGILAGGATIAYIAARVAIMFWFGVPFFS